MDLKPFMQHLERIPGSDNRTIVVMGARGRTFPYPGAIGEPVTIEPDPDPSFLRVIALTPKGTSEDGESIFYRLAANVHRATGSITFTYVAGLMVVDAPLGFEPTPENLTAVAQAIWTGSVRPTKSVIVTTDP